MDILREQRPRASQETVELMQLRGLTSQKTVAFLPIVNTEKLKGWALDMQMKLSLMTERQRYVFRANSETLLFPDHQKYTKAIVQDRLTDEIMGTLYYDKTPDKWVAFYYQSECKLKELEDKTIIGEWFGCQAVNISPIDGKLGFESSSGQDSRDFRGNFQVAKDLQEENIKAREFDKQYSKFKLAIIK